MNFRAINQVKRHIRFWFIQKAVPINREATEKVIRELDFIKRVEKQDFLLFFYLENEMFK